MSDKDQTAGRAAVPSSSLFERLRAGDDGAYILLNDLYGPIVYRWCRSGCVPERDVPDVGQQVFESVYQSIAQFRNQRPGSFTAWLKTIVQRRIADYFRQQNRREGAIGGSDHLEQLQHLPEEVSTIDTRHPQVGPMMGHSAGDESVDGQDNGFRPEDELHGVLLRAVLHTQAKVKDTTLQAFWLTAMHGYTAAQAAEQLGITINQVNVYKKRVRDQLAEILEELEPELIQNIRG